MASAHSTTPVHSHPLSTDELPSRGRRSRGPQGNDSRPSSTAKNYFTVKTRIESEGIDAPNWDGSVRGYGKTEKLKTVEGNSGLTASNASLKGLWDKSPRTAPLFIVGSPVQSVPEFLITGDSDLDGVPPSVSGQVLATKWHTYSDEAIQTAISNLSNAESPADISNHPYHTALRVLSSAVHNLSRARIELEEARRVLQEKEAARRKRSEELLKELQPSEQDVARRVIQSLFTDDDETEHKVRRKQSVLVRFLLYFETSLIFCSHWLTH